MAGGRRTARAWASAPQFSVHLPNPLPAHTTAADRVASPPTATTLEGVHVLIVEDDADAREIAARTISDAGGLPVAVGNATEALAALASNTPKLDAILSDIGLPGTDGYELLEAVRGLPFGRGAIPAIAVTAYASAADEARARAYGFVAHITKPYLPSVLVTAVRDAIGRSE